MEQVVVPLELARLLAARPAPRAGVERFCRVCFRDAAHLNQLFSEGLADMLAAFTPLQPAEDDGKPPVVCTDCRDLIIQSFTFRQQCERSDAALRAFLQGDILYKFDTRNDASDLDDSDHFYNLYSDFMDEDETKNIVKEENATGAVNSEQYLNESKPKSEETRNDDIIKNEMKSEKKRSRKPVKKMTVYCNICHKHFKDIEKLSLHMETHFTEKPEICTICFKACASARGLKRHILFAHADAEKAFPCHQCDSKFATEKDMKIHSALHNLNDKLTCRECDKAFPTLTQLKRHVNRHMEDKPHKCGLCQKTFSEVYALHRHERTHFGRAVEKNHVCTECGKKFAEKSQLKIHLRTHTGERPYVCVECGRGFLSTRLINSHMRTHSDHKPYQCKVCDKSFRHKQTLKTHRRTHTGEKPYVCSVCGKTFIQSSNLSLHMRVHTGERPYSCTKCKQRFNSSSSLRSHDHIHTGIKPYGCNVCGQKFARANMKAHMRRHTGERPYVCTVCDKAFITSHRLREHRRIHTGVKPYECGLCGMKTSTKASLVKHVTNHRVNVVKPAFSPRVTHADLTRLPEGQDQEISQSNSAETNAHAICDNVALETIVDQRTDETKEIGNINRNYCIVDCSEEDNMKGINENDLRLIASEELETSSVNLMAVGDGELSIATTNSMGLDSGGKKLYQVDQSLFHIHSLGGQLTISKITSKMTANFE